MQRISTVLFIVYFLMAIGASRADAQACTSGCSFTATSGGNYNMNGNQVLCFPAANPTVTNIGGNFNGSNNQFCIASGVTWNQTNSINLGTVSVVNIYGTANLNNVTFGAGTVNIYGSATLNGVTFNGTTVNAYGPLVLNNSANFNSGTSINVASGQTFQTNLTSFPNSLTINNAGTVTFTNTGTVTSTASVSNASGATVTATAPSLFVFGSGSLVTNLGTMTFANLENSDANQFNNSSTGTITVNRSFYNHAAFLNNGLVRVICSSASSGTCEFRTGDKGSKTFVNNSCMIVAGAVTFNGPATLNGTLEILPGYNLTINKIVTGVNGYLLVDGGTSTITTDGQYTGSTNAATSMKFYSASTGNHDFNTKSGNITSVYTVLSAPPATSCSATASCSANVAITSVTCQTATNQYVLTGTLSFSNTGGSTYTVQDGNASTTVSTTGTSPQSFTLTGSSLVSNASSHTLTATPGGTACSVVSTTYTSPANCLSISVNSATVCAGQTATLTATGCIGTVSWNTGVTATSISVATSSAITTQTVLSYTATCTSGSVSATAVGTVTVRPNTPTPTLTIVQPTCVTSTGSLTATSAGATSFTLSGPTTTSNTTGIFSGLVPGSYTVTAGNGTPCSSTAQATISAAPITPAAPTLTVIQPTCTTSTGSLTATSAGATSFTLLDGNTAIINTSGVFTSLAPGSYTALAGNGICSSAESTTTIIANPGTPPTPSLNVVQPDCNTPTGALTATSAGATSFTLLGPVASTNTTGVFTTLTPGSYTITASNGTCTSDPSTLTIVASPGIPATPTLTVIQPDCTTPTGSVTAVSSGATSFTLNNGSDQVINATGIFTGVVPNSYTITASNGSCISAASTTTIIASPGAPSSPALTIVQPDCTTPVGSLTATSAGATSFTLTDGTTSTENSTGLFVNLAPGSYTVVSGNGACTSASSTATIVANPNALTPPVLTVLQPNCTTPSGSLTATSAGATIFVLTNGATSVASASGIFVSLAPGSYTVLAGNGSCVSAPSTATIADAPVVPDAPTVVALCSSGTAASGTIVVSSPAAADGITYSIDGTNYQASNLFSNVAVGVYSVTVRQNGCTSLPTSATVSQCTPMPVGLSLFTGKWVEGSGNQLNWRTSWERNNDYFEIQRSSVAKSFETIGRVAGNGNSTVSQAYQYVDDQPMSDITYYRLKQVDLDGKISYSSIIAVERGNNAVVQLNIYPNPATSELTLRMKTGHTVGEVTIYDSRGYPVLHQVEAQSTVQVNQLNGGLYTIEIKTTNGQLIRQRFIKQ